jgi:hypothetical protein
VNQFKLRYVQYLRELPEERLAQWGLSAAVQWPGRQLHGHPGRETTLYGGFRFTLGRRFASLTNALIYVFKEFNGFGL